MPFSEKEILDQLNTEAANFTFPMLDNGYFFHGDQKLTLFRDARRWAILLEIIAWHNQLPHLEGLFNIAYTFGNCIGGDALNDNDNFFSFASDNGEPAFPESGAGSLNPLAHSIRIKDTVIPLRKDAAHYTTRGIALEKDGGIGFPAFMRGLVPEYSRLLWVSRDDIKKKLPPDLPEIFTMAAWHHPDLAGGELPGDNETFRQLAKVLETGEVSHYRPTRAPNTYWANWPEGGAL